MSTFYGGPELIQVLNASASANNQASVTAYIVPAGRYAEVQLVNASGNCNNNGVLHAGQIGEINYGVDTVADATAVSESYRDFPGSLQILNEGESVRALGPQGQASINVRIYEYVKPN